MESEYTTAGGGRDTAEVGGGGAGAAFAWGTVEVYVHHARNIHNICIYADQDVYAKFSLTCSPEEAVSTRIARGGGKNPNFDERLRVEIRQPDALSNPPVLKCEIWMLSRARAYLDDQLLGFALVPLAAVAAAEGKTLPAHDFTLSSTDLFHSPAGVVQLTLALAAPDSDRDPIGCESNPNSSTSSSITSEVVLLDPAEYGRIEIPDVNVAKENQQMVSDYFSMEGGAPSLWCFDLEKNCAPIEDSEMTTVNSGDSSTTTTGNLTDDLEKTPTSRILNSDDDDNNKVDQNKSTPMERSINSSEDEQSAMQRQIIDMYMRSMQQFTDSLAKMKLPLDLDSKEDVIQTHKKKNESRVFYGSRAFF